jgi:hypothetical protein
MRVESLHIDRRPSYDLDYPNQLVGIVMLKGANGTQEIRLTNASLSRVFGVITQEVQDTARECAKLVKKGMEDALNEPLLAITSNIEADYE